jgi:hypothetical protein
MSGTYGRGNFGVIFVSSLKSAKPVPTFMTVMSLISVMAMMFVVSNISVVSMTLVESVMFLVPTGP